MKATCKAVNLDIELPELLQKEMEEFERTLTPYIGGIAGTELARYSGALVRTAIVLKWLPLTEEQVDGMRAGDVTLIANQISMHIAQAREVSPQF